MFLSLNLAFSLKFLLDASPPLHLGRIIEVCILICALVSFFLLVVAVSSSSILADSVVGSCALIS
ncbi:MAG: hypothetical protein COW42_14910, partial [Deltaproteobacteria bacterium CG17_big_fil_post_rev_8_21_14_2_50_63_7]